MRKLFALLISLAAVIAVHSAKADTSERLPRLAGTVITPEYRAALFVTPDGIAALTPGETLGSWTIHAIEPGRAVLTTPDARREVDLEGSERIMPASTVALEPGRALHWTNPCGRQRPSTNRNPAAAINCRLALQQAVSQPSTTP